MALDNYTDKEIESVKKMLLFLIKKNVDISGGNNGFRMMDLYRVMDILIDEGTVLRRETINGNTYILNETKDNG